MVARVAPERELLAHRLLHGLAIGQVGRAARPGADEVGLVERQTLGERRDLDDATDRVRRDRRHPQPVPAPLDDLAERADREPAVLLGQGHRLAHQVADRGGLALAAEPHRHRRTLGGRRARALQRLAVDLETHAAAVVLEQQLVERRFQQGLVVPAQRALDEAGIEQRRERVRQLERHRGAAFGDQPRRRHPLPRRLVTRGQVPAGRHVALAAPRLGQHLLAEQQPELDAHAGEADALAARLGAGGDVMVAGEVTPLHAGAVVHDREGGPRRVREDAHQARPRVEGVGDDLGEDGLLERAGIGVAQVFQQVVQVDAGLTHGLCGPLAGTKLGEPGLFQRARVDREDLGPLEAGGEIVKMGFEIGAVERPCLPQHHALDVDVVLGALGRELVDDEVLRGAEAHRTGSDRYLDGPSDGCRLVRQYAEHQIHRHRASRHQADEVIPDGELERLTFGEAKLAGRGLDETRERGVGYFDGEVEVARETLPAPVECREASHDHVPGPTSLQESHHLKERDLEVQPIRGFQWLYRAFLKT